MRLRAVFGLAATIAMLATAPAGAQVPWLSPGTEHLPPDPTVPHLPAVPPVICPDGAPVCLLDLESELAERTAALGCDHDAVFSDAYLTITRALITATNTPGVFDHPDRINHEAKTYAQEYFDQYDRWHSGDEAGTSASWRVALQAAEDESVTAMGDLLLQLNAHIRRDNPIRAVEQTQDVLRRPGPMPAASGKPDHERVSVVLADAMDEMLYRLARRYDPGIDDGYELFGSVVDGRWLYSMISAWREESWRNAEALRHARGGRRRRARLPGEARTDRGRRVRRRADDPGRDADGCGCEREAKRALRGAALTPSARAMSRLPPALTPGAGHCSASGGDSRFLRRSPSEARRSSRSCP